MGATRTRQLAGASAIAALLLLVGWLDLVTGYELQFFAFYFLPVALAAWHLGRAAGLVASVACTIIWLIADVRSGHIYLHPSHLYWNAAIRLSSFVVIALSMSTLRVTLCRERTLRAEVQKALGEVRLLRGLLPICSSCKRIRNEQGTWEQLEAYVRARTDADFTHGLCPECVRALYPELADRLDKRSRSS
jgi:glucose-6-phosphate-specific signal transduction histidine kinase